MTNGFVFIEFKSEFEKFEELLITRGQNKFEVAVLCFDISLRRQIASKGYTCIDPTDYFGKEDHIQCLRKLDLLEAAVLKAFQNEVEDKITYYHSTLFYLSFLYSHILYYETLGRNILKANSKLETVFTPFYKLQYIDSPRLENEESCLFAVSKTISNESVNVIPFEIFQEQDRNHFSFFSHLIGKIANFISLSTLKSVLSAPTLVLGASTHRCDIVVNKAIEEYSHINTVSMAGLNRIRKPSYSAFLFLGKVVKESLIFLFGKKTEKRLDFNFDFYPIENEFLPKWSKKLNNVSNYIRNLDFCSEEIQNILSTKLQNGIAPLLASLENIETELTSVFISYRPIGIVSPHSLNGTQLLGDISKKLSIPGLLISHGSHSVPQDESIKQELFRHGLGLIHSNYDHVAIQSPLASDYLDHYKIERTHVQTGPLLWGTRYGESGQKKGPKKIITHAGSQKPRESIRFLFYETPDEYVQSILELVEAVKGMDDVHCIIRFRPTNSLTLETLKELVLKQENVEISSDGPFLDVLAKTDLLVSYSSTTMEEAIENRVPVLQYSKDNRFMFLPSTILKSGEQVEFSPVYSIDSGMNLRDGLRAIMDCNSKTNDKEKYYKSYSIPFENRMDMKHLVGSWCGLKE